MIRVDIIEQTTILGETHDLDRGHNYEHNNLMLSPKPYAKFTPTDPADPDTWEEAKMDYFLDEGKILTNLPSDPFYAPDSESHTSWIHVADYTTHPLSTARGETYHIHARINNENALEFGIFMEIVNSDISKSNGLFEMNVSNDTVSNLTIASKAESEKYILNTAKNKVKISSCAKCAGYMINNEEIITDGGLYRVYGHIWTYWYVIDNNKLYFCGLPLYTGNDRGRIELNGAYVERDLPPTVYDTLIEGTDFYKAYQAVRGNDEGNQGGAKRILNEYGDTTERTYFNIILNEVENEPHHLESSNISSDLKAISEHGGIYKTVKDADELTADGNMYKYVIAGPDDLSIYKDDEAEVRGNSAYATIPIKAVDAETNGDTVTYEYYDTAYALTNFSVIMNKNSYAIYINDFDRLLDGEPTPPPPPPIPPFDDDDNGWWWWIIWGGRRNRRRRRTKKQRQVSYYLIDMGTIGNEYRATEIDEQMELKIQFPNNSKRAFVTVVANSSFKTVIGDTSVFTPSRKYYTHTETQAHLERICDPYVLFNWNSTRTGYPYDLYAKALLNYGKMINFTPTYEDYHYYNSYNNGFNTMRYGINFRDQGNSPKTDRMYFKFDGRGGKMSGIPQPITPANETSLSGNLEAVNGELLSKEKIRFSIQPGITQEHIPIKPVPSSEGGAPWVDTYTPVNQIVMNHSIFEPLRTFYTNSTYSIRVPGVSKTVKIKYRIRVVVVQVREWLVKRLLEQMLYNFRATTNPVVVRDMYGNNSQLYYKDVNQTYTSSIKQLPNAGGATPGYIAPSVLQPPSVSIGSPHLSNIDLLYTDEQCNNVVNKKPHRFYGKPRMQVCAQITSVLATGLNNDIARVEIPFQAEGDGWWEGPDPAQLPEGETSKKGRYTLTFADDPTLAANGGKIVITSDITKDMVIREVLLRSIDR